MNAEGERKAIEHDDDNPDWMEAGFVRAKGPESLPPEVLAAFPKTKVRGPQKAPTKRLVSLRLDLDVIEHFKATGEGWQSKINATLRGAMAGASKSPSAQAGSSRVVSGSRLKKS